MQVFPLEEGATALMYACQQENVDYLQAILERKPELIKKRDKTFKNVLHYCVENSSLNCAQVVLNAAPDLLDAPDKKGFTPLHLAVISGNALLVKYLLSNSADVNKLDAEGHSAVHWATVCGELELLQFLLKCGADASTSDVHGCYPLHYAAQMCGSITEVGSDFHLRLSVMKLLLSHHIDVNARDHDSRQPLLWAASAGASDAVLELIRAGASVQSCDKDGLTALHCAASRGHTDCLETLIELCGANVDEADNNGCSALFYSVTLGHADATHLLLRCGADPNHQDFKGRTAAHCGAAKGQFETLRIFKNHNGNLWLRNTRGDYCLHAAVTAGRKDLVKWLLSQKPEAVNFSNLDGRTSLHIAAITNNVEMCKILLDYRSLINPVMKTNKGDLMTPLDAALVKGNRGFAKYLQLHGGVPSNKLTSFFATLRGSQRIESYSDYPGFFDHHSGALSQKHNSRSLNNSPCTYREQKSRKVKVRLEANSSSESTGEFCAVDNGTKYAYNENKLIDENFLKMSSKFVETFKTVSYHSSNTESNFSDNQDFSLDIGVNKKTRKYRKLRKRSQKRKGNGNNHQMLVNHFNFNDLVDQGSQNDSRVKGVKANKSKVEDVETDKLVRECDVSANQYFGIVTVPLLHVDNMHSIKKNESSENGFQEIQYQKLEAVEKQVNDYSAKLLLDNKNNCIFQNNSTNIINENFIKKDSSNKLNLHRKRDEDYTEMTVSSALPIPIEERSPIEDEISLEKVKQISVDRCKNDQTIHAMTSVLIYEVTGINNITDEVTSNKMQNFCDSETVMLMNIKSFISNTKCVDEEVKVKNKVTYAKNYTSVELLGELKNTEYASKIDHNDEKIIEYPSTTKLYNANLLQRDKSLTCVILDDEKNVNTKQKKDKCFMKNLSGDLDMKRKICKFKNSFLVLSDDREKNLYGSRIFNNYDFKTSLWDTQPTAIREQFHILQSANRKDILHITSIDDFESPTKALKRIKVGKTLLQNAPDNPLLCTHGTYRCIHATHAYTAIPYAAYRNKKVKDGQETTLPN